MNKIVNITRTQVYGLRCSGTNYLDALIKSNLLDLQVGSTDRDSKFTFGWKHGDVNTSGYSENDGQEEHRDFTHLDWSKSRDTLLIVIYRNPFTWLQSLQLQPHHVPEVYNLSFSDFIRHEWKAYYSRAGLDLSPFEEVRSSIIREDNLLESYESVFEMRSSKIRIFESFKDRFYNVMYVNYETLEKDPESVIRNISKVYGIKMKPEFCNVNTYKGGDQRYVAKNYDLVESKDLQYMLDNVDWPQESDLGYSPKFGARTLALSSKSNYKPSTLLSINPVNRFYINGKYISVENEKKLHQLQNLNLKPFSLIPRREVHFPQMIRL